MTEIVLDLLEAAFSLWNSMIGFAMKLLVQSPETFSAGKPWELIERIEPVFIAIGCNLTSILFLAGWANESLSFKEELRPENMLRMFLRLSITEALVVYSMPMIRVLFYSVGLLIKFIASDSSYQLAVTKEQENMIKDAEFWEGMILCIFLLIFIAFVFFACFFIVYTMFFRFLRILAMIPYGAVALSAYAGSGRITDVMVSYIKNLAAVLLEGISIVLSIEISNLFMMYGIQETVIKNLPSNFFTELTITKVLIQLLLNLFTIFFTVGAVKSARDWTGRMLGLG